MDMRTHGSMGEMEINASLYYWWLAFLRCSKDYWWCCQLREGAMPRSKTDQRLEGLWGHLPIPVFYALVAGSRCQAV